MVVGFFFFFRFFRSVNATAHFSRDAAASISFLFVVVDLEDLEPRSCLPFHWTSSSRQSLLPVRMCGIPRLIAGYSYYVSTTPPSVSIDKIKRPKIASERNELSVTNWEQKRNWICLSPLVVLIVSIMMRRQKEKKKTSIPKCLARLTLYTTRHYVAELFCVLHTVYYI